MVPQFVKMMNEEEHLKMKQQATACMTSLIRGLLDEADEEGDDDSNTKNKKLLEQFSESIVESISRLLELSLEKKYQPLQDEVLMALSCLASLMENKFAVHYSRFMPGLKKIL